MKVNGTHYRTIWVERDTRSVSIIDQTLLPHRFKTTRLASLQDAARAITTMQVRGAPLIGATAAYGIAIALRDDPSTRGLRSAADTLLATRPTAVNLRWAIDRMVSVLREIPKRERPMAACQLATEIANEDVHINASIGEHGFHMLETLFKRRRPRRPLNILTHCNAGWLATVDWGTALAPIYRAHDAGIPVHVWVDETRPRNQGAALTAWELGSHGVPHTVIVDNAGGHLMQHGKVDICIVGTDRTAANGDVANKIGTYLKALAAHDNGVPFYVALPGPTIDWSIRNGVKEIPIEERAPEEVTHIAGATAGGRVSTVRLTPRNTHAANPAFDVTPARLITGLITERGICPASRAGLRKLYPKKN